MLTRPSDAANAHAQGDVHHHIVVRQQLDKLRIDLQPLQLRLQLHQVGPRVAQRRQRLFKHAPHDRLLDFGQFPDAGGDGPRTAQQPIDNDKSKIRRDLDNCTAFQRRHAENADERRIGQRAHELVVRRLDHGDDFAFHDGPHVPGQIRGQAARKALVNDLQRPQLIFREFVRAAEIVPLDGRTAERSPRQEFRHGHCTTKSVNQT